MNPAYFDHIEVHVEDIPRYCEFLVQMFCGGRYKVISETGTSMFSSRDGLHIEIKKKKIDQKPAASGFCNPCIRMENAREHIEKKLQLKIDQTLQNPDGPCYFFTDHEGIVWHIKDYLVRDKFVNW